MFKLTEMSCCDTLQNKSTRGKGQLCSVRRGVTQLLATQTANGSCTNLKMSCKLPAHFIGGVNLWKGCPKSQSESISSLWKWKVLTARRSGRRLFFPLLAHVRKTNTKKQCAQLALEFGL